MAEAAATTPPAPISGRGSWHLPRGRSWLTSLAYGVLLAVIVAVMSIKGATDYVGLDNDDGMRLIEIRDFLAGQDWFDLMQYRLGLLPGTLMHWSRLIDLPIAGLIAGLSPWLPREQAEAVALAIWPLSLIFPTMLAMGRAGHSLAGRPGMHLSLLYTAALVFFSRRFGAGAIDHHNIQLVLAAALLAMVVEPKASARHLVLAGCAAGLAVAIGAETVPYVASICAVIALRFAIAGEIYAAQARAFGLSLAASLSLLFVATISPRLYGTVSCDNFSLGFYGIASVGGLALALATLGAAQTRVMGRALRLIGVAGAVGATVLWLAPQCLRSPLADLDPVLADLWLSHVAEAKSLRQMIQETPYVTAAYYATAFLALALCLARIALRQRVAQHLILLLPLAVSLAISVVQVRGALFSLLVSIGPLVMMIADLRRLSAGGMKHPLISIGYIIAIIAAVPQSWGAAGLLIEYWRQGEKSGVSDLRLTCNRRQSLQSLADMPAATVAAPSDLGVAILRFTQHRVLSAPYHRNQKGMLAELELGMAEPEEAAAILQAAGATILVFCPEEAQTDRLIKRSPTGLYARLARRDIPLFLKPLPSPDGAGLSVFTVQATPKP